MVTLSRKRLPSDSSLPQTSLLPLEEPAAAAADDAVVRVRKSQRASGGGACTAPQKLALGTGMGIGTGTKSVSPLSKTDTSETQSDVADGKACRCGQKLPSQMKTCQRCWYEDTVAVVSLGRLSRSASARQSGTALRSTSR